MNQNRLTSITIIAIIFAFAAGIFAYYQKKSQGQTASLDLISTIIPSNQNTSYNVVQITTKEYNQTLAAILNAYNYQSEGLPQVAWEADLNSSIIHGEINSFKVEDEVLVVDLVTKQSQLLTQDLYNSQLRTNLKLLKKPTLNNSTTQNPLVISILGLLVGGFLDSILLQKKD